MCTHIYIHTVCSRFPSVRPVLMHNAKSSASRLCWSPSCILIMPILKFDYWRICMYVKINVRQLVTNPTTKLFGSIPQNPFRLPGNRALDSCISSMYPRGSSGNVMVIGNMIFFFFVYIATCESITTYYI